MDLHAAEKANTLFNKFDLIGFADHGMIFKMDQYSKDPAEGYQAIFEQLKTILPDFNYSNFEALLIEDKQNYNDLIEQRIQIRFDLNGITYRTEGFYNFRKKGEPKFGTSLRVFDEFQKGINKYLADLGSERRLFYANNSHSERGVYDDTQFGMILMTEAQQAIWDTSPGDYFLSDESFDVTFTSKNIQNIIRDYENIGLFAHLSPEELDAGKALVQKSAINTYQDILSCFPKTIVFFDWESGNLENPYEELTLEFAAASRGVFTSTNITDDFKDSWEKSTVNYGFEFNGTYYSEELEMDSDWLDYGFMQLIESALLDQNISDKIHFCRDGGQATGIIILNPKQLEFIQKNQPDFFPEEE